MSKNDPVISVIGPAIKVQYWKRFYKSCVGGNIPWEIVFVGPVPPQHKMAPNFRHIKTNLKPAQCLEIAAMHARGEYFIVAPDDITFHHESLDWALWFKRHLPPFSIVGMRYRRMNQNVENNEQALLVTNDIYSPILPICGIIAKAEWEAVGGVDRRFVGSCGDTDIFMRCRARGGHPFISPNSIIYEHDTTDNRERLSKRFRHDYRYFVDLWVDKGADGKLTYPLKRRVEVLSLDRVTIMEGNQGNVKGWA